MNTVRPCGCKGCRTCLLCEKQFNLSYQNEKDNLNIANSFVYCPECDKIYRGWDMNLYQEHPNHKTEGKSFPGVYIKENFLSLEEESEITNAMDKDEWQSSQCGRRKQNYGPKCNFNKKKLKRGEFNGFPKYSQFIQEKFKNVEILHDFQTIEQCAIEYEPSRGSWIPPHIDDCWVWGNRIITVNLMGDSVLTLTVNSKPNNYNLSEVPEDFLAKLNKSGLLEMGDIVVRIPMPNRSLLVLFDNARYNWEHQILREDIYERRICLAYREFTLPFLIDDSLGITEKAKNFF